MKTYFASAERLGPEALQKQIRVVSNNPIIDKLLQVVSGLLAVLNEDRQIVGLNEALLEMLGVGEAEKVLGLRLGEAINCIHAHEMPGGCGTSEYCSTCGAAIAIVVSLGQDKPVERTCAVTVEKGGQLEDLYFRVRAYPTVFDNQRLLLLFLWDITSEQKLAKLKQVLFHDINNSLMALSGASELLTTGNRKQDNLAEMIYKLAHRITREIEMQKLLLEVGTATFKTEENELTVAKVIKEIQRGFAKHPVAQHKTLMVPSKIPDLAFKADFALLMRVLNNMLLNAFEASDAGDTVKVWVDHSPGRVTFSVWNRQAIPSDIAKRIFQRNFSTKADLGRGLGTFSMKLFGEGLLGGKVDFTTSESEGTVFRFSLNI